MTDINIVRPNVLASMGASVAPVHVSIHAPALFQLLEFSLRSNERVLGTLVGTRSDDGSELEVRDAFIVPHHEEGDELVIEEGHNRTLYQLHKRSHPRDSILGWFATTEGIDSFTALVHDFYSRGPDSTFPHPALHLTLSAVGEQLTAMPQINTYIGAPLGAQGITAAQLKLDKGASYIFTPVANDARFDTQERTVLEQASLAVRSEEPVQLEKSSVDLNAAIASINKVDSLIDSTVAYIEKIETGEIKGDDKLARLLLANLETNVKKLDPDHLEKVLSAHVQDTLMVEYLASAVKTQLELSAKLTTLV